MEWNWEVKTSDNRRPGFETSHQQILMHRNGMRNEKEKTGENVATKQLLLTPEDPGSKPVITKFFCTLIY